MRGVSPRTEARVKIRRRPAARVASAELRNAELELKPARECIAVPTRPAGLDY